MLTSPCEMSKGQSVFCKLRFLNSGFVAKAKVRTAVDGYTSAPMKPTLQRAHCSTRRKKDRLFEPLNQLTIHRTRASFRKISQQTGQPTKAAPAKWQPQLGFVGEAAQRLKTLL